MNSYETVNNILVKMFRDILDIEERALITSEYKDISVNDMHIMEAIGIQESKNMSAVAKAVSVDVYKRQVEVISQWSLMIQAVEMIKKVHLMDRTHYM